MVTRESQVEPARYPIATPLTRLAMIPAMKPPWPAVPERPTRRRGGRVGHFFDVLHVVEHLIGSVGRSSASEAIQIRCDNGNALLASSAGRAALRTGRPVRIGGPGRPRLALGNGGDAVGGDSRAGATCELPLSCRGHRGPAGQHEP